MDFQGKELQTFEDDIETLKQKILDYEKQSEEMLAESIQRASLMKHAPKEVRYLFGSWPAG